MILQVIFTISDGQAFVERKFPAENMEKLTIQSRYLIKGHLLSGKL